MAKIPNKVKYLSYAGIIPIIMGVIGSLDLYFISNRLNLLLVETAFFFSASILSFLGGCLFVFETHSKSEFNFKGIIIFPNWWLKLRFSLTTLMVISLVIMGFNV